MLILISLQKFIKGENMNIGFLLIAFGLGGIIGSILGYTAKDSGNTRRRKRRRRKING